MYNKDTGHGRSATSKTTVACGPVLVRRFSYGICTNRPRPRYCMLSILLRFGLECLEAHAS